MLPVRLYLDDWSGTEGKKEEKRGEKRTEMKEESRE